MNVENDIDKYKLQHIYIYNISLKNFYWIFTGWKECYSVNI